MQYRTLGRTGLRVSAVSMGTWNAFDVQGERAIEHVGRLVTEALACGVNLFDTAPMYGEAESVLGRALRGRRDGRAYRNQGPGDGSRLRSAPHRSIIPETSGRSY